MSELLSISPESEKERDKEVLAAYDTEMEEHLARQARIMGATAFEVLARPMETVQPIEAVNQTDPYTTGPDNNGKTHTDYGDVEPEPPQE